VARRAFAIVGLLVLVSHTASAQNAAQYLALAREYAAGQGADAVERLSTWPRDDITAAAIVASVTASSRDLIAAAMLHTDLANTIIDGQPDAARFHVNKARGLLSIARGRLTDHEHARTFSPRWFRFVVGMFTSCELLDAAVEYELLASTAFPENPHLYVARGIIQEVRARKTLIPDLRRGLSPTTVGRRAIENLYQSAATQFLHALSIDSHDAEARLHLGWVRFFLGDKRAKGDLDAALTDARDDTVRYLAHLFLGGLAEREDHLAEALGEYESARAVGAGYQTPYVAMSRIEDALGHADRARELALVAVQLEKSDDDPWWDHRIGFDREGLNWLRAEARRP
jgi:tetratricopeptide (TPR) repeat protein